MTTTPTPPANWDYLKKAIDNWPKNPPPLPPGFGRKP